MILYEIRESFSRIINNITPLNNYSTRGYGVTQFNRYESTLVNCFDKSHKKLHD